jgi:hypothetical protein
MVIVISLFDCPILNLCRWYVVSYFLSLTVVNVYSSFCAAFSYIVSPGIDNKGRAHGMPACRLQKRLMGYRMQYVKTLTGANDRNAPSSN